MKALLFILLLMPLLVSAQTRLADIELSWKPLPIDSGADGYRIYYGPAEESEYTNRIEVSGIQTASAWVRGIQFGRRYKFSIVAFAGNIEGQPSADIFYTPTLLEQVKEFKILQMIISITPSGEPVIEHPRN